MSRKIYAFHHHAVHTVNAENQMNMQYVRVLKITSVYHQHVDQNVQSVHNVHSINRVKINAVSIHVLDHVVIMHNVKLSITIQFVVVRQAMLAIHLFVALWKKVSALLSHISYHRSLAFGMSFNCIENCGLILSFSCVFGKWFLLLF